MKYIKKFSPGLVIAILFIFIGTVAANAQVSLPNVNISLDQQIVRRILVKACKYL